MSGTKDPTAAKRKADERQRDHAAGIAEVRGIKAPLQHHEAIKAAARDHVTKLQRKRAKEK